LLLPAGRAADHAGWFRQYDWQHNALLYHAPGPAAYVAWLRDLGVSDVFVPRAALDMSSTAEPSLIVSSGAFMRVFADADWTVYRLRHPAPLVVAFGAAVSTPPATTAPARGAAVTAVTHDTVTVTVRRVGSYVVKFTWTPYWRLAAPVGSGGIPAAAWRRRRATGRCCAPDVPAPTCCGRDRACGRRSDGSSEPRYGKSDAKRDGSRARRCGQKVRRASGVKLLGWGDRQATQLKIANLAVRTTQKTIDRVQMMRCARGRRSVKSAMLMKMGKAASTKRGIDMSGIEVAGNSRG